MSCTLYNEKRATPYCLYGERLRTTPVLGRAVYKGAFPTVTRRKNVLRDYKGTKWWRDLCGEKTLEDVGLFDEEPWTD